ncbi:enhancer of rudimentary, partial [Gorgonomyces haynaldii]
NQHTIVLIQRDSRLSSRIWAECPNVQQAVHMLVQTFEDEMKRKATQLMLPNLTYSIQELQKWCDDIKDLAFLVYDAKLLAYVPHDRSWVKENVILLTIG